MVTEDALLSLGDQRKLLTFLSHIVGKQDAEDVAQETYLRAHRYRSSFDGRSKFSTWIFQIAKYAAFDCLRRARTHPYGHSESLIDIDFEQPVDERRLRFELASELRRLPRAEALIVLTYVREGSCKDAARVLGIPLGTVKSRLFRTRKRWLSDS